MGDGTGTGKVLRDEPAQPSSLGILYPTISVLSHPRSLPLVSWLHLGPLGAPQHSE